jgi:hypothetical protein
MPVISVFFGMIGRIFCKDEVAVFSVGDGAILSGSIPKTKESQQSHGLNWGIHKDDLLEDWALTVEGSKFSRQKDWNNEHHRH